MFRKLLTLLLSIFGFQATPEAEKPLLPEPPAEEMIKLKEHLSGLAAQIAKEAYSVDLDFSLKSVENVEKILSDIHLQYKKSKDDGGLQGVAAEFGAYLISVIEKNYEPGAWKRDHPTMGQGSLPYHWRGSDIFPVSWCVKRIFDGPGDDVSVKFKIFVIEAGKPPVNPK